MTKIAITRAIYIAFHYMHKISQQYNFKFASYASLVVACLID
jgi:hypothetical protein